MKLRFHKAGCPILTQWTKKSPNLVLFLSWFPVQAHLLKGNTNSRDNTWWASGLRPFPTFFCFNSTTCHRVFKSADDSVTVAAFGTSNSEHNPAALCNIMGYHPSCYEHQGTCVSCFSDIMSKLMRLWFINDVISQKVVSVTWANGTLYHILSRMLPEMLKFLKCFTTCNVLHCSNSRSTLFSALPLTASWKAERKT